MKKIVFVTLALALVLMMLVAGCGQNAQQPAKTPPVTTQPTPAPQPAPAPAPAPQPVPAPVPAPAPTPPPAPTTMADTGRAVMTVGDPGINLSVISSVMLTVDSVSVHSAAGGWMTVSSTPMTYDLLQLKAQQMDALLADVQLKPGTYEQLRLNISKVVVTDANGTHDAKLPSGDLKIVGKLIVDANATSTAMFDFDAGQSLMMTGNGEYILAPVVHLVTMENTNVTVGSDHSVKTKGGKVRTDIKVGMDEHGNVGVGVRVTAGKNISIDENGMIKVKGI